MPLNIEVGKRYLRHDAKIRDIVSKDDKDKLYPFVDEAGLRYATDGTNESPIRERDLVCACAKDFVSDAIRAGILR